MKKILFSIFALLSIGTIWADEPKEPKANDYSGRYNAAAAAFSAKDFSVATTGFENLIKDAEDDPTAMHLIDAAKAALPKCYFMMAGKAMQETKYADAEKFFQKSVDLAAKYGDEVQRLRAGKWLAKLFQIEAKTPFANKDYGTASAMLAKGYAADSTNMPVALKLAWSYGQMALNTGDAANYTKQTQIFTLLADSSGITDTARLSAAAKATEGIAHFRELMLTKLQGDKNFDGMTALADSLTAYKLDSIFADTLRAQAAAGYVADSLAALQAQADSLAGANRPDSLTVGGLPDSLAVSALDSLATPTLPDSLAGAPILPDSLATTLPADSLANVK